MALTKFTKVKGSTKSPQDVGSLTDLRALDPSLDGERFNLISTLPNQNVDGGVFYYDASDTTSTDDDENIIVTTTNKRLKRLDDTFKLRQDLISPDGVNLVGNAVDSRVLGGVDGVSLVGNAVDIRDLESKSGFALVGQFESIADLRTWDPSTDGERVLLKSWHEGLNLGGGEFYYDASDTASLDNDGTTLVTNTGKRFKRLYSVLTPSMFGAKGDGANDDRNAITRCVLDQSTSRNRIIFDCDCFVSDQVVIDSTEKLDINSGIFAIKPLTGFSAGEIVTVGSASKPAGGQVILFVDCLGIDATGVNFVSTANLAASVKVFNHNGHGIIHSSGYELKLTWETRSVNTPLVSPSTDISNSTNVGFISTTSDSIYYNGVSRGCDVGQLLLSGNNQVINCHHWSVYTSGVRKMRACFIDKGENNRFHGCMADSPCVLDYDQIASNSNGGYGFYTPLDGNGFFNTYTNCTVFIPTIAPELGSVPLGKIVSAFAGRSFLSYNNFNTIDRTSSAIYKEFDGAFVNQSSINSKSLTQIRNSSSSRFKLSSSSQFDFDNAVWLNKGAILAVDYVSTPDAAIGFGQSYQQIDRGGNGYWYHFIVNDEGVSRDIRIEKIQSGSTTQRDVLNMTTTDAGYKWFNTTTSLYEYWNGTSWVNF